MACCFDEVALFALDKDEKIKVYDLMALQKSEFFDYEFFLTSAEEMNMIIKGYQNLPIQLGFAPQRNNDMLINDLILPITNFLDPPIDYWMNKKYIYILYTKKIMIYVRKELLTLGKLKSFEKMNSTLGEYSYITWELELENKRVHRGYPQKNDSLLVMLDVDTNKSEL